MLEDAARGLVEVPLGAPPVVVGVGRGVHGSRRQFERWQLPELYSVHFYEYRGELVVGGVRYGIKPGHVSLVPPGAVMEFHYEGRSEHLYAHLAVPAAAADSVRRLPLMQDLGLAARPLTERVRTAILHDDPARRSAELWSVLWAVASLTTGSERAAELHPAVESAMEFIDAHLAEHLTAARIAGAVRYSPSHLDRLFRAATGSSLSEVVRTRRMTTARHLLEETTQPIASIAASVGIPDLQSFNKACRRFLGRSPRRIRGPA